MPKVSVIIPIYNVSRFIEKCASSLVCQTLDDIELIFVDDASPDDSIERLSMILKEHPERNARIIHHEKNLGLPSARNSGLNVATGEYVFHCDGDDWLEPFAMEKMYECAKAGNADIVYSDFYITYDEYERRMTNPVYENAQDLLVKGFLCGATKYNVWNKLVRRSIYSDNGIVFPDGHPMGEDMTMILVAACASSISYLPIPLYHYVKTNASAYSQSLSPVKLNDIKFNVSRTVSFLQHRYGEGMDKWIAVFKLSIKWPFLITDDKSQYEIWYSWYPEANKYIWTDNGQSVRMKAVQWFASRHCFMVVSLHYWLLYKVIYRIIYSK